MGRAILPGTTCVRRRETPMLIGTAMMMAMTELMTVP
jgi:hypothetical protein